MLSLSEKKSLKLLMGYLWRSHKGAPFAIGASVLFLVAAKVAALIFPLVYKRIVDQLGLLPQSYAWVLWLIAGYGVVRFSSVLFTELRDMIFVCTEQRAIRQINLIIFKHLHHLSVRFHFDRKTGELTRILERGGRAIESFFRYFVFNLFPTFIELILVASVIFWLYPVVFGLIILATLLSYVFFTFKVAAWRLKFMRGMNKAQNRMGQRAVDSLLNFATVKYFGNEVAESKAYDAFLASYQQKAVHNKWSLNFLNLGQGVILTAGVLGIMYFAMQGIQKGQLTLGDFVLLYTYLLQVYMPLYILGFAYRELKQALLDMEGLFGLLAIKQEVRDVPQAPALSFKKGRVVFDNVSFAYDPQRPLLKNISLAIEPGEKVAIVGGSGAGKSTLVSLLMRFFDPQEGSILLDDQPICKLRQDSVRKAFGIVPQDTVLFNDTLFYNIHYGRLEASKDEVLAASKIASLDGFVKKLPKGYQTLVGERGLKLSGGEKQRVGIARAVLKKPPIFIFDEATSALDTRTERAIQKSLDQVSQGYTTLIIAHRLSTIVDVDRIFVLEEGQLVEQGTHAQLLKAKGLYYALWQKQKEGVKAVSGKD